MNYQVIWGIFSNSKTIIIGLSLTIIGIIRGLINEYEEELKVKKFSQTYNQGT